MDDQLVFDQSFVSAHNQEIFFSGLLLAVLFLRQISGVELLDKHSCLFPAEATLMNNHCVLCF